MPVGAGAPAPSMVAMAPGSYQYAAYSNPYSTTQYMQMPSHQLQAHQPTQQVVYQAGGQGAFYVNSRYAQSYPSAMAGAPSYLSRQMSGYAPMYNSPSLQNHGQMLSQPGAAVVQGPPGGATYVQQPSDSGKPAETYPPTKRAHLEGDASHPPPSVDGGDFDARDGKKGKAMRQCKCGSWEHRRSSHHTCPLNMDKRWRIPGATSGFGDQIKAVMASSSSSSSSLSGSGSGSGSDLGRPRSEPSNRQGQVPQLSMTNMHSSHQPAISAHPNSAGPGAQPGGHRLSETVPPSTSNEDSEALDGSVDGVDGMEGSESPSSST